MILNLKKNVLISGGSKGIGAASAEQFLKSGCNVGMFSRSISNLNKFKSKLKKKYPNQKIYIYEYDATKNIDYDEMIFFFKKNFNNKIDILVNNVGGGGRWGKSKFELSDDIIWQEVLNKNFIIAQRLTMSLIPDMISNNFGRVITIASILGKEAGGRPWFNSAKSAQISMMKTLSKYKRACQSNITFNTVAPGAILIPETGWSKLKKTNPNKYKKFEKNIPVGRLGKPKDVANLVLFLSSLYAEHINGACITVDGGESHSF